MDVQEHARKMNFHHIYDDIAKRGKTIGELALKYGMEKADFSERMEKALGPKVYSQAVRADARTIKLREKSKSRSFELTPLTMQEENKDNKEKKEMARRKTTQETNNQASISITDEIEMLLLKKKEYEKFMSAYEVQRAESDKKIKDFEKKVNELKAQYEKAKKELLPLKKELAEVDKSIQGLKNNLEQIEKKLIETENKAIYLVAPGFKGEKPKYGCFYSTTKVEGFDTLSVANVLPEYGLEPDLTEMLVAGYDSYKEYAEGLKFVMLCIEYTCTDKKFNILVDNKCINNLLRKHVGAKN
jgi:hypothetical protein